MPRRKKDPVAAMMEAGFDMARMTMDAQFVIAARMAGLATGALPRRETVRMLAEKQAALAEGVQAASFAAATGKRPDAIAKAAIGPARKRLAANRKRLSRRKGK